MASDAKPLDMRLFNEHDDVDDLLHKRILEAMVNGDISPKKAATNITAWIVEKSNEEMQKRMKQPREDLTPEEEVNRPPLPNASRYINSMLESVIVLCGAFPPDHPGQDRIIQFLEALREMPECQVPESETINKHDSMITLWPFDRKNFFSLPYKFRFQAEDYSYPFSDIETPGSDLRQRWRNFQSAMSRLTVTKLVDCSFLCALQYLDPSAPHYPNLQERKIGGPNRIGGDLIAGSEWILRPEVGPWVYQECKKFEKVDDMGDSWDMWCMQNWRMWKRQLAFVVGDKRFSDEVRVVADRTGKRMVELEEEYKGSTTD
ncbi:hypothetical protein BGZ60DRAFT_367016 [Tricladium varicosporioides]|nr:hypothetical protein BGZ60DRAFT_367016 [Hymenoscyphus varicosporioides]